MTPLAALMNDVHPDVRRYSRVELQRLAGQPELLPAILSAAMSVLMTDQWRGLEQSGLLLGALDHKPAAERLVELLDFEREEVGVAAAWALRKLQIASTLPGMLRRAEKNKKTPIGGNEQQEQLFQAFGLMRYQPADALLQTYIPKATGGPRVAAIWALGHLYDGKNPPDLVKKLTERVADESTFPTAEMIDAKTWASVSIGRMRGQSALPTLRQYFDVQGPNSAFGQAIAWAIHQITDEPIPKPILRLTTQPNWFLRPVE
jgi:HEAT repeat protein